MPKPLKKKPQDENQLAYALVERLAAPEPQREGPVDFETQYKAHMAKLGAKGGKVSGSKRMDMPPEERRRIASLAARAMWAKRKGAKKPLTHDTKR